MRSIVIGTAGHIDHGKTALVRALTGTDTDRLKEEKARGITIELGFAQLQLDPNLTASIVDVPGHERFVRNMVAGTTGIDMVLMVVAADEAVMPQTREHLDICNILGVERGLVALTKMDLVEDPQWLDMVTQDLRSEFAGSFLAESPIIAVSSRTGQGLDVLKKALCNLGNKIPARSARASTFLAIDRTFTMRGFGAVVTGTLTSGSFQVEEQIDILPDPSERLRGLKIRGLQVHNQKVQKAEAGRRCAVNLSGIDHNLLSRGQVLSHTDSLRASTSFVCTLQLVPGTKMLRTRTRAAFHTGTTHSLATVRLLDTDRLNPGQEAFVSIHCDTPIAALVQHRYILRGSSIIEGRGTTMGGGRILSVMPSRRTRRDKESWLRELECLRSGDDRARVESFFRQAGPSLLDHKEVSILSGLDRNSVIPILKDLVSKNTISSTDADAHRFVDTQALKELADKAEKILDVFHQTNPLLPGIPAEQLRQELMHKLDVRLYKSLLDYLSKQGIAMQQEDVVRLSRHKVQLSGTDSELESKLRTIFIESQLAPPFVNDIAEQLQRRPGQILDMLKHLTRSGFLVHVSGQMFIATDELNGLRASLIAFLEKHQEISIQDFKTLVNGSRKHVIPLAEYFDQEKTTLRVGQKRVLRKK